MSKHYSINRTKDKYEVVSLELDDVDSYKLNSKINREDVIDVEHIIIYNLSFIKLIIKRKIDKKIGLLIKQLNAISEEDDTGEDTAGKITKSLMDCEKLRMQIINNYSKYLGHTYESLTLEKIELISSQLRYGLYALEEIRNNEQNYTSEKSGRRGR